jgi:diaminopropionate ammonia-lyase
MAGYTTILRELEDALHVAGAPGIDLVLLQVGVGSWAAAAVLYYCLRYGAARPRLVCVEPAEADCLLESARRGRLGQSRGSQQTIMAGLNCGTPSTLAWDVLKDSVGAVLAIPDEYARRAMRRLARPAGTSRGRDPEIVAGESGAAGLAGLLALATDPGLAEARARVDLGPSSRVLLFNTEGDTDPESYRMIVGAPD